MEIVYLVENSPQAALTYFPAMQHEPHVGAILKGPPEVEPIGYTFAIQDGGDGSAADRNECQEIPT